MNTTTFLQKVKRDLPELGWHEDKNRGNVRGDYFVTEFTIEDGRLTIWSPGLLWKHIFKIINFMPLTQEERDGFIDKLIDKDDDDAYYDGIGIDLDLSELNDKEYTVLLQAIKKWMNECDTIRKSDDDIDQIVLIHPDLDEDNVPCFLRDCKCIVGSGDWRAGIISTKDWDLDKPELHEAIIDSTGDCFGIGEDYDNELEYQRERGGVDYLEELEKVYPGAKKISRIYTTDWD